MAVVRPWGSNNPYTSLRIDTSGASPMGPSRTIQATSEPVQAPRPQRPTEPVQLYRLDGTPYGVPNKSQKVRVAKDMYDGQDPPQYKSKASYTDLRAAANNAPQMSTSCGTCGGGRSAANVNSQGDGHNHQCNKCGKKKSTSPRPSVDVAVAAQRSTSEGSASTLVNTNISTSTTMPIRKTCHKCGRSKRPVTAAADSRPVTGIEINAAPPVRHIAGQHIMYTGAQSSPLQSQNSFPRKPVASSIASPIHTIDIDIIPPTAVSERPQPNVLTHSNVDQSPLLESNQQKQPVKPRRSTSISSIASSISRSLSRKRSRGGASTGSQERSHPSNNDGEYGPGRLLNMITSVIRGGEVQDYSKLGASAEGEKRAGSPFSFVDKPGEEALELADMDKPNLARRFSWDEVDVQGTLSSPMGENPFDDPEAEPIKRPEHLRLHSDGAVPRFEPPPVPEEDIFLAAPGQRPELTRFKSLRSGVQRAGSVARSQSLKRFNSLKNAPQYWYRTDMAFEGAVVGAY